jgi:restriction system protein
MPSQPMSYGIRLLEEIANVTNPAPDDKAASNGIVTSKAHMQNLTGTATIECTCGIRFPVDSTPFYMDLVDAAEREMGAEIFWQATFDVNCPKCHNEIHIEYEMSEYPDGVVSGEEYHLTNGKLVKKFSVEPVDEDDELYRFQDDIPAGSLYIPNTPELVQLSSGITSLILRLKTNTHLLYDLDPRQFEELICEIFKNNGFNAELTKRTRDGGRDIIAIRSDMGVKTKYLIECKKYAKTKPVTVELVRALYGVHAEEGANKSLLVTTSYFSPDARKFVSRKTNTHWHLDLKDYEDVVGWLREYDPRR